jgi:hypothetical protein
MQVRHATCCSFAWLASRTPTRFEAFARAWTKAKAEEHRLLTPEYAYLTDLQHQRGNADWKAVRATKAKSAIATLSRIAPSATSMR